MNLKQIIRSVIRDRLNTAVIIVSLVVGIVSFSLVLLFISRELGTDSFHEFADQIYALKCDDPWMPGRKMYHCRYGSAEYMKKNFTGVDDLCRIGNYNALKIKINNEDYFEDIQITGVSENFFRFFSYDLKTNNPENVLATSKNLVISSVLASKYFGTDDPLGRVITLSDRNKSEEMTITGVFKKPAQNTQINFDMVRLIGDVDSRCYIRLTENTDPVEMERIFLAEKQSIPVIHTGTPGRYYLEPLRQAYFDTSRGSVIENSRDKRDLWIAAIIGLMIIGVAIFNYLGVLANKFHRKTREYHLRRINGSSLSGLTIRFMLENAVILAVSFAISLFLIMDALPFFNSLTGSKITLDFIIQPDQIATLTGLFLLIALITLLYGVYLVRSNLDLNFLRTNRDQKVRSIQIPAFNIFQLASSAILIVCSIIIIEQMNFISDKQIGLDKDVIEIKIPPQYKDKAKVFREELKKNSSVSNVSVAVASPLLEHFLVALKYQQDGVEKEYSPSGFGGDENYLDVLGIKLVEGTGFSGTVSSNAKKCVVNQSFARMFTDRDLIGKGVPGMEDVIITGIVEDFHFSDLKSKIEPAFISFSDNGGHLLVKASDNQTSNARTTISGIWQELIPDYPLNIESVGDRFLWYHRKNSDFKNLIVSCSVISLFLSMIGLFAVSYQKSRSRIKEIGIRKINGANVFDIMILINKDILSWTGIAFIIAVPASWYAMNKWLETYAYKTEMTFWIFASACLLTVLIAILTVSWQSLRAATRNPVEALRYE